MEAFIGYWAIACIALMAAMPLTALAITARRNREAEERLQAAILQAIVEHQKSLKNT